MKQKAEIYKNPFLTGMNIFFLAVAIFMPVFSEVNRYYIRYVNSRVEYSFGDLITVLTLCFIPLFSVIFDVLHRQHKRIQALEQEAAASEQD